MAVDALGQKKLEEVKSATVKKLECFCWQGTMQGSNSGSLGPKVDASSLSALHKYQSV